MVLFSLTLLSMFLIFDTETTGLPKRDNAPVSEVDNWPRVVQIAWQLHDDTGDIAEHYNLLIQPEGFEIPYAAEKIHGISTQMATKFGLPLEEALYQFDKSVSKSTILIGHNISFDMNALGAELSILIHQKGGDHNISGEKADLYHAVKYRPDEIARWPGREI